MLYLVTLLLPFLMAYMAIAYAWHVWTSLLSACWALVYDWFGFIYIEKLLLLWWPVILLMVALGGLYYRWLRSGLNERPTRLAAGISALFYFIMLTLYTPTLLMHGFSLFAQVVLASDEISILGYISNCAFLGVLIFLFVYWVQGVIAALFGLASPRVYLASQARS